jgi:hypothetical protein
MSMSDSDRHRQWADRVGLEFQQYHLEAGGRHCRNYYPCGYLGDPWVHVCYVKGVAAHYERYKADVPLFQYRQAGLTATAAGCYVY